VRKQTGFDVNKVKSIAFTRHPDWALYHQNKAPRTYHEAQVSLPFSVAVAFLEGQALLKQYSDRNIRNAKVKQLSNMTTIAVDAKLPRGVSCKMVATLADGRKFTSQIDYPKGSIQNSMSDDELLVKFTSLAVPVIGAQRAGALAKAVMDIENCADVSKLLNLASKK
jgi:2-methylcitrate dehydratase PrpD